MIYSEKIKLAMNIAYNAHINQVDKGGYPYISHPLHLAELMKCESSTIVALLHDVIEDSSVTLEELKTKGFDEEIITALKLLTKVKNIDYFDYIKNVSNNALAKEVKIADLKHNSDLTRLDKVTEKDIARAEKYKNALKFLESN